MRRLSILLVLSLLIVTLLACSGRRRAVTAFIAQMGSGALSDDACSVRRAAIEIGSGSTRLRVGDVVFCPEGGDGTIPVAGGTWEVKMDLLTPVLESRRINPELVKRTIDIVGAMKERAARLGACEFAGVATEAFRRAQNSVAAIEDIERAIGIPFRIVASSEEARLGFLAATAGGCFDPDEIVVWDIGADGASFSALDGEGGIVVFRSGLRSFDLEEILGVSRGAGKISMRSLRRAVKLVEREFGCALPERINRVLKRAGTNLVGIGPVFHRLVPGKSDDCGRLYTKDIRAAVKRELSRGTVRDSRLANLILVQGTMAALDVASLVVLDVNLADGMLVDSGYWMGK